MPEPYFQLGDMLVVGEFSPKMMKALAVIAAKLHPAYDALDNIKKWPATRGNSKESCLFSSLAVREFLVGIGFADATVQPCTLFMRSERDGVELHSLGIGVPGDPDQPDKFNGHVAVIVPSENILIDTTLYQAIREQWQGAVSGMMAVRLDLNSHYRLHELKQIAGMVFKAVGEPVSFEIAWGDRPDINWRREPDATDPQSLQRRRRVAKALREGWRWEDAA
jgi:hypothetical protein